MSPWSRAICRSCLIAAGLLASELVVAQTIQMVFRDKPPYSYVENGEQRGFLLEKTRRILATAGVNAEFSDMPPKRIFAEIEANEKPICSFGWYKIPERERYAWFSASIHQDRPHLVLVGQRASAAIRQHKTLKSLMGDGSLVLASADGVSYGPELDAMIASFPGKRDRALVAPLQVARKLSAGRADFMFIDQEDYDYLMATNADFRGVGLQTIPFPDMPPGLKRYILCSRKVPPDIQQRIDSAIGKEAPQTRP